MMSVSRRDFLCAVGASSLPARLQTSHGPLNIVFILADDLGWAELGCYGNSFNETPNLDLFASRGVRFTDAYAAAPVCSPTRAAIMTGLHPARVGITDYLRADDPRYLSPHYFSLPKALKTAGYHCGLIGKWHLMGDYALRKGDPKLHGFDEVICSESSYIGPGYYFPPYQHMKEVQPRRPDEYLTDRLNEEAVEFIERNRTRPFFLFLSHYAPHTRLAGKPELVKKYASKPDAGKKRNNPELAAMIESIDQGVGMIWDTLRRLGLADRTVVVFSSDNGGEERVTSNAPLRAGKSTLYEGGIRVPLIVAGPGFGKPGSVSAVPVVSMDLYATFLAIAGTRAPQKLDGIPIQELLKDPRKYQERTLFWHYPLEKPHFLGGRSSGAVRQGNFKLIEFYDDGTIELYNLKEDLGETTNLSGKLPAQRDRLLGLLRDWRKSLPR